MAKPDPIDWTPPDGDCSEPDAGVKAAGYQVGDRDTAQETNWFMRQVHRWLAWLDVARWRHADLIDDYVPSSTPPSTGSGLVGTSGSVESAYVTSAAGDARRVTAASEAKTYTASKDTYVDLTSEGAFTYSAVNNGAGAPSLAAGSIRLWKVVTNGSNRTTVTVLCSAVPTISAAAGLALSTPLSTTEEVTIANQLNTRDVKPSADNAYTSGGAGKTWSDIYATLVAHVAAFAQHLLPSADVTYNLGSSAKRWNVAYADNFMHGSAKAYYHPVLAADFMPTPAFDPPAAATESDPRSPPRLSATGTAGALRAPLALPHGAIVTGCEVFTDFGAGTQKAMVVRRLLDDVPPQTGDTLSATYTSTGDTLSAAGPAATLLTIDASEAIRTINNLQYTYELWVYVDASTVGYLYGARVAYTLDTLRPA